MFRKDSRTGNQNEGRFETTEKVRIFLEKYQFESCYKTFRTEDGSKPLKKSEFFWKTSFRVLLQDFQFYYTSQIVPVFQFLMTFSVFSDGSLSWLKTSVTWQIDRFLFWITKFGILYNPTNNWCFSFQGCFQTIIYGEGVIAYLPLQFFLLSIEKGSLSYAHHFGFRT